LGVVLGVFVAKKEKFFTCHNIIHYYNKKHNLKIKGGYEK